jgi:3-phytase
VTFSRSRGAKAFRAVLVATFLLSACAEADRRDVPPAVDSTALRVPPRVSEVFLSQTDSLPELHGLAVWQPAEGEPRIVVSATTENAIQLRNWSDGSFIEEYRRRGRGAGALGAPVGVATHDSLVFVVEKTNHRVQVFRLPSFEALGSFGNEELIAPEWIALLRQGRNVDAYVSDRADLSPDTAVATRIRIFRLNLDGGRLSAGLMRTFGEEGGLAYIRAIVIDSAQDRILVADRSAGVIAFTLGGDAAGLRIAADVFAGAPGGLALHACGRDNGHVFVTDTARSFHVFDRETLAAVTRFWGRTLAPTADILFAGMPDPTSSRLLAVHARSGIGAIAWPVISDSIPSLRACPDGS